MRPTVPGVDVIDKRATTTKGTREELERNQYVIIQELRRITKQRTELSVEAGTITLLNGWETRLGTGNSLAVWQDPFGNVWMDGSMAPQLSSPTDRVMFILPEQWRPQSGRTYSLPIYSQDTAISQQEALAEVLGNGTVRVSEALRVSNNDFYLDSVRFRAEG